MIETTDNYALVYFINYYIGAINSSAPAVAGLLTYATKKPIAPTTMEGIHAAIHAEATS